MKKILSDEEIIQNLSSTIQEFEQTSQYLFQQYKGYIFKVKDKLHLNQESLEDAYADSLVKLIRKIKNKTFKGESKISTYFYSIFYNTCVDVTRKNASNKNIKTVELSEFDTKESQLLSFLDIEEKVNTVMMVINTMGNKCQGILMDWAYHGYSMQEIANRSELRNAESARSMKYKCLKILREKLAKRMFD